GDDVAAAGHRVRQKEALLFRHAPPEHRHTESGDLRVGSAPVRHGLYEKADLPFREGKAALFAVDHVINGHSSNSLPMRQKSQPPARAAVIQCRDLPAARARGEKGGECYGSTL